MTKRRGASMKNVGKTGKIVPFVDLSLRRYTVSVIQKSYTYDGIVLQKRVRDTIICLSFMVDSLYQDDILI